MSFVAVNAQILQAFHSPRWFSSHAPTPTDPSRLMLCNPEPLFSISEAGGGMSCFPGTCSCYWLPYPQLPRGQPPTANPIPQKRSKFLHVSTLIWTQFLFSTVFIIHILNGQWPLLWYGQPLRKDACLWTPRYDLTWISLVAGHSRPVVERHWLIDWCLFFLIECEPNMSPLYCMRYLKRTYCLYRQAQL